MGPEAVDYGAPRAETSWEINALAAQPTLRLVRAGPTMAEV